MAKYPENYPDGKIPLTIEDIQHDLVLGSGETVFPSRRFEADEQLWHLLPDVLRRVESDGRAVVATEVDLGLEVGMAQCVETRSDDEIVWAPQVLGRPYTRFVRGRAAEPTSKISLVMIRNGEDFFLQAAYFGLLCPPLPNDPVAHEAASRNSGWSGPDEDQAEWESRKRSREFWATHALRWEAFEKTLPFAGLATRTNDTGREDIAILALEKGMLKLGVPRAWLSEDGCALEADSSEGERIFTFLPVGISVAFGLTEYDRKTRGFRGWVRVVPKEETIWNARPIRWGLTQPDLVFGVASGVPLRLDHAEGVAEILGADEDDAYVVVPPAQEIPEASAPRLGIVRRFIAAIIKFIGRWK